MKTYPSNMTFKELAESPSRGHRPGWAVPFLRACVLDGAKYLEVVPCGLYDAISSPQRRLAAAVDQRNKNPLETHPADLLSWR